MALSCVIEAVMAGRAWARVSKWKRLTSSRSRLAQNDSAGLWSWHEPTRPTERVLPSFSQCAREVLGEVLAAAVVVEDHPPGPGCSGSRRPCRSRPCNSSQGMVSPIAHPTSRRERWPSTEAR